MEIDASELLEVARSFETATGRIGGKVATAIRKTAFDIERDAKALAPVDTGNLRNSISTSITGDGRGGSIQAEVGPTAEYARFVEEGTSRMSPQPYMRPAFDRRSPGLEKALDQIAGDI